MQDINDVMMYVFSYISEDWFSVCANNITEATVKAREYASIDSKCRIRLCDIKWDYADNMGWIGV